jgi:hypothetical protein
VQSFYTICGKICKGALSILNVLKHIFCGHILCGTPVLFGVVHVRAVLCSGVVWCAWLCHAEVYPYGARHASAVCIGKYTQRAACRHCASDVRTCASPISEGLLISLKKTTSAHA